MTIFNSKWLIERHFNFLDTFDDLNIVCTVMKINVMYEGFLESATDSTMQMEILKKLLFKFKLITVLCPIL